MTETSWGEHRTRIKELNKKGWELVQHTSPQGEMLKFNQRIPERVTIVMTCPK